MRSKAGGREDIFPRDGGQVPKKDQTSIASISIFSNNCRGYGSKKESIV